MWGFLGSAAVPVVRAARDVSEQHGRLPALYRRLSFYITNLLLAALAGLLALAHGVSSELLAIHIGVATPLIIIGLAKALPPDA